MAEGSVHHGSTDDHGASVAAWFGVLALMISSAIIAVGVYINNDVITIVGVAVGVIGLVAAIVLAKLGFGVAAKRRTLAEARASGDRTVSGHH
jgi:hypothetical protein